MYFDAENLFSKDQAVTVTAASTNTIDVQRVRNGRQKDIGHGRLIQLFITVSETFKGLTSLQVAFETSDNENLSPATTLIQTAAIPASELIQGYTFSMTAVPDGCRRYIRLNYIVSGTATAGKITAGIVVDRQQTKNMGG